MNNILKQPFSNIDYANFAVYANETQRRIEDFNGDKYALLATEILVDGTIQDISQTPDYIAEQLTKAKADKLAEIDLKAKDYEQNGIVEYKNCLFEMSDSNRKNLSDTQEALTLQGLTSTQWNSKDDTLVELTIEDIQNIRLNLILGGIQKLWLVKQPYYKNLVEKATTVDEVNAIVIDYSVDVTE